MAGRPSAWDELAYLASYPLPLALLALATLALLLRRRWLFTLAALAWAIQALATAWTYYGVILDDTFWLAMREGCVGPPHLFILSAIAICAWMTFGALRHRN